MPETSINVAIRVRPSLPGESIIEDGPIKINDEGTNIEIRNVIFSFDTVFSPDTSNECVYKKIISNKIKHLIEGFNVTILAYGSTGSGKTFTMGTAYKENSLGLIPLGLTEIFEHIDAISLETDVVVKVSFFEIYMENVKDLLKSQACFVPGDTKDAKISNMSQISVKNYNEAIRALRKGCQARITAVTTKNAGSSRSHAFYIISLVMTDKKTGKSKFSKFQLVDLAGSERTGADTSGKEFKQGIHINKGLTALGRVISSLSNQDRHIPYRDSVLTRYLQDSIGGNSHTVMVTCISPAQANIEETLSSLRYSACAKKIKNHVTINRGSTDLIEHFRSEIERLRKLGMCEEKEGLINKINHLDDCLKKKEKGVEKIKEKVLEFSASVKSLEEMMVSETFKKPCIEIVRNIKKDLNCFLREQELFSTFLDKDTSSSCEKMNISPNISPSIGVKVATGQTEFTVDDLTKVNWMKMELKNCENLKVLYHLLQCEEKHKKITSKLERLLNEKEKLCTTSSKVGVGCDEVNSKIQSLEKEIQECQQKVKLCALAVEKKKNVLKHYDYLKQSLKEQEEKFDEGSGAFENQLTNLEEEAKKIESLLDGLYNGGFKIYPNLVADIAELDIGGGSLAYIERSLRTEICFKTCEYEIKKFANKIGVKLDKNELNIQELQNKSGSVEKAAKNSNCLAYEKRISDWWHSLKHFRKNYCCKLQHLNQETTLFLLDYLLEKAASLESDHHVMMSRFSELKSNVNESDKIKFLELELHKIKNEKYVMDMVHKRQIIDLNSEWESKMLVLLENACKNNEALQSVPSNIPMDMTTSLQNLWSQRDTKYEEKCKENEALKKRLCNVVQENEELRCSKFKLPNLATGARQPKSKSSDDPGSSMMEVFLSDDEISFNQESELLDPDYRGTPLWKRNRSKAKRKSPEDCDLSTNPKPPKTISISGCSCPSDCGTMRCSCKKKKQECSTFCECNKAKCMNSSSSNEQ